MRIQALCDYVTVHLEPTPSLEPALNLEPALGETGSDGPLMTLRGGQVGAHPRRVARVIGALCLSALAILVVFLFVAGARKNAQIGRLEHRGVAVEATVSGCIGLLGGSGSNQAGYQCTGGFELNGRHYSVVIPDNSLHATGAHVRLVAARNEPTLVSTPDALAKQAESPKVFLVPSFLALVLVTLVVLLGMRRTRQRSGRAAQRQAGGV